MKSMARQQGASGKLKRRYVNHSLEARIEVLRLVEKGESRSAVSRATGIPTSTIGCIMKNAAVLKAMVRRGSMLNVSLTHSRQSPARKQQQDVSKGSAASRPISKASGRVRRPTEKGAYHEAELAEKAALTYKQEQQRRKKRTPHPLAVRLEVVRRCESGEKISDVSRDLGIAKSTVHNIMDNANRIKAQAKTIQGQGESQALGKENETPGQSRHVVMESMERLLKIWLDECTARGDTPDDKAVCEKASCLWKFVRGSLHVGETKGVPLTFRASTAWLHRFRQTTDHNVPLQNNQQHKTEPPASTNPMDEGPPQSLDSGGQASLNGIFRIQSNKLQEVEVQGGGEEAARTLDVGVIRRVLGLLDEAMALLEDNDSNYRRRCRAQRMVERGMAVYRELLTVKTKKTHHPSLPSKHPT